MSTRITVIGLLTLALMVAPALVAKDQGFSGKWVLDKSKSGDIAGAPEIRELEIRQKDDEIVIKSKYDEPRGGVYPLLWLGVMAYELKLKPGGAEAVNLLGPFKHQSKTTVDGNRMATDFVAANEAGEAVTGQWIRTLSPDGREMTCEIRTKAADGRTLDKTLVFRRK